MANLLEISESPKRKLREQLKNAHWIIGVKEMRIIQLKEQVDSLREKIIQLQDYIQKDLSRKGG